MSYQSPPDAPHAGEQSNSPYAPPSPTRTGSLARAALVVGIAALVVGVAALAVRIAAIDTGWIMWLGLAVGVAGVILSILAINESRPRGFGITGLVLSGLGTLTSIVVIGIALAAMLSPISGVHDRTDKPNSDAGSQTDPDSHTDNGSQNGGQEAAGKLALQTIQTPCYRFDGPAGFINNQSSAAGEDCVTTLELWGEVTADGTVKNLGVGSIYGQVRVEPIRVSTSEEWADTGDTDGIVKHLAVSYIPQLGALISLEEPVTLGGEPANITRTKSDAALTKTKALVVVFAPESYESSAGDIQLFIITLVTPYDNGDELLDAIVSSWQWK